MRNQIVRLLNFRSIHVLFLSRCYFYLAVVVSIFRTIRKLKNICKMKRMEIIRLDEAILKSDIFFFGVCACVLSSQTLPAFVRPHKCK